MDNQENYNLRLENLSKEVDNVTDVSKQQPSFFNNFLKKINTKYLLIGSIPIILIFILIFLKVSFIMKTDEKNPNVKKINFVKVIFTFIMLILLTIGGTYIYNYKNK
jgi:uncharacterized membrane protein